MVTGHVSENAKTGRCRPLSVGTSNISSTVKNCFVVGLIKVSTGIFLKLVQISVNKDMRATIRSVVLEQRVLIA